MSSLPFSRMLVPAILIGLTGSAAAVDAPDKTAPLSTWTPVQQWMPHQGNRGDPRTDYGYGSLAGALALADELGDKFSELGRASLIDTCFKNIKADESGTLAWAMCGNDVNALDLKKLEAELTAEGVAPGQIVADATEALDKAKKIGAAVEALAKDDPGIVAVLKLGDAARAEWTAYLAKNRAAADRFLALKDAVRSGKSNNKGFADCYKETQPPMAKLVKATKFPFEINGDPMVSYVALVIGTTEGYITTVAYAACAISASAGGEAIYAAAANVKGGQLRFGWRSIALAKALDANFKPKFADRKLAIRNWEFQWRYGVKMALANDNAAIMTPKQGVVGSMKVDGDDTKISFKGDTVDECLQWKETNKVQQVSPNGSVSYEKTCLKRGKVANQESAISIPTKYLGGISVGTSIQAVSEFPVAAWKGKTITGMFGVAAK